MPNNQQPEENTTDLYGKSKYVKISIHDFFYYISVARDTDRYRKMYNLLLEENTKLESIIRGKQSE